MQERVAGLAAQPPPERQALLRLGVYQGDARALFDRWDGQRARQRRAAHAPLAGYERDHVASLAAPSLSPP